MPQIITSTSLLWKEALLAINAPSGWKFGKDSEYGWKITRGITLIATVVNDLPLIVLNDIQERENVINLATQIESWAKDSGKGEERAFLGTIFILIDS